MRSRTRFGSIALAALFLVACSSPLMSSDGGDAARDARDAIETSTADAPADAGTDVVDVPPVDAPDIVDAGPDEIDVAVADADDVIDGSAIDVIDVIATPDAGTDSPSDTGPVDVVDTGPDVPADVPSGSAAGAACAVDGDCASGMCRVVDATGTHRCTVACTSASDCASITGWWCDPTSAGATSGICVPPSTTHCASCSADEQCGPLSERCTQINDDPGSVCHIDCSLGANACPPEYRCEAVMDGTTMRQLCLPPSGTNCGDAFGGYCVTGSTAPVSCDRTGAAGTCTGTRVCNGSGRLSRCSAVDPVFLGSCFETPPTGCTVAVDPAALTSATDCGACGNACSVGQDCCGSTCIAVDTATNCGGCGVTCTAGQACCAGSGCTALDTVSNCGACGNVCPGQGLATDDVACSSGMCGLTCRGENYDVDGDPTTGCERADTGDPHTSATARSLGSYSCTDTTLSFTGRILSDSRIHTNPAVTAFDATTGAAPDEFSLNATGGLFCVNDLFVMFTTTGGSAAGTCYRLTVTTDRTTRTLNTSGNGTTSFTAGSGSYTDGSIIHFRVEKTCSLPLQENVLYTVSYHI